MPEYYKLEDLVQQGELDLDLTVNDPSAGAGTAAGEGTLASGTDRSLWVKLDAPDTDWERFGIIYRLDVTDVDLASNTKSFNGPAIAETLPDGSGDTSLFRLPRGKTAGAGNNSEWVALDVDMQGLLNAGVLLDSEITNLAQVKAFDSSNYATAAQGTLANTSLQTVTLNNVLHVAKNGTDTRAGFSAFDVSKPYLTPAAALADASSGDLIVLWPGDYSAEADLGGKDGVNWKIEQGATSPSFNVTGAFTFTIDGDIGGHFIVDNASANVACKGDVGSDISCGAGTQTAGNAGTSIYCGGGTQTAGSAGTYINCDGGTQAAGNAGTSIQCDGGTQAAGNAGTYILCLDGTQTAGNAGTFILCLDGTQTAGNAGTYIECSGGTQIAGNAGTYINCAGGTQAAGNAGTYIECAGGTQTINNANTSHDGTTRPSIYLSNTGSLTINNSRIESTESGAEVVEFAASWSGTFITSDCTFVNTTASSKGISYGATVTGNVQLKNCTIITGTSGVSIDAPSAQTVYIQGILNVTHELNANVDWFGTDPIIDPGFQ